MIYSKICLMCGKLYKPNHRTIERQKYCSKTCSAIRWQPTKIRIRLINGFLEDIDMLLGKFMGDYTLEELKKRYKEMLKDA